MYLAFPPAATSITIPEIYFAFSPARNTIASAMSSGSSAGRWDYAIGTEVRYRFNKKDNDIRGFYVSAGAGYEQWTIEPANGTLVAGETRNNDRFTNAYAGVGIGYIIMPFKNTGLYAGLSYGLIFILNNTENRNYNGSAYNIRSVVPPSFIPNINIGWRFGKSK